MDKFLSIREQIYNHFHGSPTGQAFFFKDENRDCYAAYYTSMYLLQDTGEALCQHRQQGFSKVPLHAYIEFWGVMQAILIQQDAIRELFKAIIGTELKLGIDSAWYKIRNLRNQSVGHPAKRDKKGLLTRTFMGRNFGSYSAVTMEEWNADTGIISHPRYNLAIMLDDYEKEAVGYLQQILDTIQEKWPMKEEL